jgi:hypothetical protein
MKNRKNKEAKKWRQATALENAEKRALRSDSDQIALAKSRRGNSSKEIARMRKRMRSKHMAKAEGETK